MIYDVRDLRFSSMGVFFAPGSKGRAIGNAERSIAGLAGEKNYSFFIVNIIVIVG